jgi:hypothetical protein
LEQAMSEPQADALIDRLRRGNRRWKAFALGTLVALVLAAGAAAFAVLQVGREKGATAAARTEAEQARQETKDALENAVRARSQLEQHIYAHHLQMAQQAREESARKRTKP